jgi:Zn-dependent protease with chaperone function
VSAAVILIAYAVVATVAGGRALTRARWPQRSPGWGVVAWQALTASVAGALLLAGVAVALPFLPEPVARVLGTDAAVVIEHYETPVGPWPGVLTLAVSAATAAVVVALTVRSVVAAARSRRTMRRGLEALGRRHPDGYTVLEHPAPLVYCLPGRARTVVVTRGALDLLSPAELQLVLGHERRHLRARHDLALALSRALATTFRLPVVRALFEEAHRAIGVLIEMSADDTAREDSDRRLLAGALVSLSSGSRPVSSEVGADAGSDDAAARVRRLESARSPLSALRGALVGLAAAVAILLPLGLSVAPAVEAAATGCCATTAD